MVPGSTTLELLEASRGFFSRVLKPDRRLNQQFIPSHWDLGGAAVRFSRPRSTPRSCSGTPVQPLSPGPVVGAEARRTRTSPQVAFCHADSESAARACRCAPDVTCAGRHVLLDRSFMQRAVQPPHEDELVWHTCCIAMQTGCTGIQHAVLCRNRQAKAELDGLRIEMSLVHDNIDNSIVTSNYAKP